MRSELLEKEVEIIQNELSQLKGIKDICVLYSIPCPDTDHKIAIKGLEFTDKMQEFISVYMQERRMYNV
jgi:hypothetical protein